MNFEERLALFKELFIGKPEAKEARQLLKSLQKYQPRRRVTYRPGSPDPLTSIYINNPRVKIKGSMIPEFAKPNNYTLGFSGRDGLRVKTKPAALGSPQNLAERAVLNQLLNELPPKSSYNFEAIREPEEKLGRNKRASTYRRYTKGALNAYIQNAPWGGETWMGFGKRVDQERWQAKDSKGRYTKAVKFNPVTVDNVLNKLGKLATNTVRSVYRANPYVQGALTADDILKAYTGKGVLDYQKEQLGKTLKKQPDINLGPILPF
tara:strand:+ start:690 stop:1481 length:792 start_codon:yes stop_codon:yes gene_type:complete